MNKIPAKNLRILKTADLLIPLSAALIICRSFDIVGYFYFAAIPVLLFAFWELLTNQKKILSDPSFKFVVLFCLMFGIWAIFTSIWSPLPSVSASRGVYFILISVSSVYLGYLWCSSKNSIMLSFLIPSNIVVVTISVISLVFSIPEDSWTGGHGLGFKGYAVHQNMLASVIVFTVPGIMLPILREFILSTKNNLINRRIVFLLILLLLNVYLLIISASRGGLLSFLLMAIIFYLLILNWKWKIILIISVSILSFTSFNLNVFVHEFIMKTEKYIGDRRIDNIKETIIAAKEGALIGIGYGISKPPSSERTQGRFEQEGKLYIREKMISTLAIIEETGLVGLILFASPIFLILNLLIKVLRCDKRNKMNYFYKEKKINTAFMISAIVALCFHAQIEAWWIGVGSIQLPLFFMFCGNAIGIINDHSLDL